jgi:hypothetical protein
MNKETLLIKPTKNDWQKAKAIWEDPKMMKAGI